MMLRWACAIAVVAVGALSACGPAKNASADVKLIDGTTVRVSELHTAETLPAPNGGLIFVLGVPIPLETRIKLNVTGGTDAPCDVFLTHVTRVGPGDAGPKAYEYVVAADSTCHLKAKSKYESSLGPVQTGDDPALLRP
jgi:hypothetical protein